jgi:Ca2+-binding EF-hand superfamily protein
MKTLGILAAAGATALVLATGFAAAKEPTLPAGERSFSRLDSDKNGKLGVEELKPRAERRFMRLDADKDGAVSSAEIEEWLKASMERRRKRIMTHMDADKDGRITTAEVDAYVGLLIGAADGDKDGGVTLAEAKAYYAEQRKKFFQELRASRSSN